MWRYRLTSGNEDDVELFALLQVVISSIRCDQRTNITSSERFVIIMEVGRFHKNIGFDETILDGLGREECEELERTDIVQVGNIGIEANGNLKDGRGHGDESADSDRYPTVSSVRSI